MRFLQRIKIIFCFCIALCFSCKINLKDLDSHYPDFLENGPEALFREDFPFKVSALTKDINTTIPPTRFGCNVRLLCDGKENFEIRFKLLENARSSIYIQTYIFYNDPIGQKVASIVRKKNDECLDVRLIFDAYTKFYRRDRALYSEIERSGLEVLGYEPLYFSWITKSSVLDVNELNYRFHEKYFIVDDQVVITGGSNIADEYAVYGTDPETQWRDQDVLLTGAIVSDFVNAFLENYMEFQKKEEERPEFLKRTFLKHIKQKDKKPDFSNKSLSILEDIEYTDMNVPVRFIRSRPRYEETYIHQAYLHLFNSAKESIIIENSYLVPDRRIKRALLKAAKKGIDVTIITNSEETNDVFQMQPITRYYYLDLIKAGIKIYEWQGYIKGHGSLHSKFAIIDGKVSIIGSFNLDPRSKNLNSEDVVLIYSPKVAFALREFVEKEDLPRCELITKAQAEKWHSPKNFEDKFKLIFGLSIEDWW